MGHHLNIEFELVPPGSNTMSVKAQKQDYKRDGFDAAGIWTL